MKITVGTLVLFGTGLALAQTPAQPRGGQARTEPGSGAGETRAHLNQLAASIAAEFVRVRTSTPALLSGQFLVRGDLLNLN